MKPQEMLDLRADYLKRIKKIAKERTDLVATQRLGSERMIDWEPYHDLLDRGDSARWTPAKRRWLDSEKDRASKAGQRGVMHGFDKDGRLLILPTNFEDRCTYLFHDTRWVDEIFVSPTFSTLTRHELTKGRVSRKFYAFSLFDELNVKQVRYEYEKKRLVRAHQDQWEQADGKLSKTPHTQTTHYHLSADGSLERVTVDRYKAGEFVLTETLFAKPIKADAESLCGSLEELLIRSIPAVVKKAKVKGPLAAVILAYCGEDITTNWPGDLLCLTQSLRDELIATHGPGAAEYIWSPDEWSMRTKSLEMAAGGDTKKLEQLRTSILQAMHQGKDSLSAPGEKALRAFLRRVALRLNGLRWGDITKVTDDFVVAAVDNTLEYEYDADVKASLPKASYDLLKKRKLV
jgi:hypothetical protein